MKINSIAISNMGPHRDTAVDLSKFAGIVAIVGENGAGKTFLLEAVPACLYGVFPTREGSLYDRITNGFEGDAEIAINFTMDGMDYNAVRKLKRKGKTTESQAYLTRYRQDRTDLGGVEDSISGPKITDFEQTIVNLVGTREQFFASVFSSQQNTGDVCDARPAERKAVFSRLLGLERYDLLSADAKAKATVLEADLATDFARSLDLRNRCAGVERERKGLEDRSACAKEMEAKLEEQRMIVSSIEAKEKIRDVLRERMTGIVARVRLLEVDIRGMEFELDRDRTEYVRLKKVLDRAPQIEKAVVDLETSVKKKEEAQRELAAIEKRNGEARVEYNAQCSEIDRLKSDREAKRRERSGLYDQAKLLNSTPDQACCEKCPLVANAVRARAEMPGVEAKIDEADRKTKEAEAKARSLSLESTGELEVVLRGLTDAIDSLKREADEAPALREAQERMSAMAESGKAKNETIAGKRAEQKEAETELTKLMEAVAVMDKDVVGLSVEIDRQRALERSIREVFAEIGILKEKIRGMEAMAKEADEIDLGMSGRRQNADDLRAIEQAFGRSGIQPLIIEQARPELEDISGEMLGAATGGRMRVRFETQRELKGGEKVESLDVVVSRDGFDLDIGEFSGGEQKLIRTAVRLTLAVWQARRGGSKLRTLFIDEVFDSLDAENSERMLRLMESLAGQFDRILLISHDDDLLGDLPNRIEMSKGRVEATT